RTEFQWCGCARGGAIYQQAKQRDRLVIEIARGLAPAESRAAAIAANPDLPVIEEKPAQVPQASADVAKAAEIPASPLNAPPGTAPARGGEVDYMREIEDLIANKSRTTSKARDPRKTAILVGAAAVVLALGVGSYLVVPGMLAQQAAVQAS